MRILIMTALFILILSVVSASAYAGGVTYLGTMTRPTDQIGFNGTTVVVYDQWSFTQAHGHALGVNLIAKRDSDNQEFVVNGDLNDQIGLMGYFGVSRPVDLISKSYKAPRDSLLMEDVLNFMRLTGSPTGQKLISTLAKAVVEMNLIQLPKETPLTAEYFNAEINGLNPVFFQKLQNEIKSLSKGKISLEVSGKQDHFTRMVKQPEAAYLVAIMKTTGQRQQLIITKGENPIVWGQPRLLTKEEMRNIKGR